ncbi:MAG: hypothetical protein ACT4TC_09530 [Myxococcaceae bacterium]
MKKQQPGSRFFFVSGFSQLRAVSDGYPREVIEIAVDDGKTLPHVSAQASQLIAHLRQVCANP